MSAEVTSVANGMSSAYLGAISWDPHSELFFPTGLPGFEAERRMLPVEIPAHRPLVYLQSLEHSDICFLTLPAFVIDPDFELHLSDDERHALELAPEVPDGVNPRIGVDVLCLALLAPSGNAVEANLDAPIVINLHNLRGIQCVPSATSKGPVRLANDGKWVRSC